MTYLIASFLGCALALAFYGFVTDDVLPARWNLVRALLASASVLVALYAVQTVVTLAAETVK